MNNRIAKKILLCASTLSANKEKVLQAREHLRNNSGYFKKKHIYLFPKTKGVIKMSELDIFINVVGGALIVAASVGVIVAVKAGEP